MPDKPIYADPNFWQGAAAIAALVLSQLPPIKLWFKRAKLDVECFDRMALKHDVGAAGAELHLTLTNTGGTDVRIKKISLSFTRGTERRELDARGYYEKSTDKQATLFTPTTLKPKESWSYNVNFFKFATREARQEYSTHGHALRADIVRKVAERNANRQQRGNGELVEADPALVTPLLTLFDAQFFWRTGEYLIELVIETDKPYANTSRKFRCTLFEGDSERLRAHRDHLKYGNGVFYQDYPVEPYLAEIQPVA
ncbi:hypothetical protein WJ59_17600 [Burkholderia gladioli]|uniref:hypothetical protein n=1 Tax=Burkholderia gladioli TaxID=28095 RepID=UPI00062707E9|nr:hypothetical protein [Burkholderia gladioli]KKJ02884.1 hypothetical protein XF14_30585 [Burkholderia gladioli]KVM65455.1 hypothetical protein WJ59_17600 [Burkholderia gladioli]